MEPLYASLFLSVITMLPSPASWPPPALGLRLLFSVEVRGCARINHFKKQSVAAYMPVGIPVPVTESHSLQDCTTPDLVAEAGATHRSHERRGRVHRAAPTPSYRPHTRAHTDFLLTIGHSTLTCRGRLADPEAASSRISAAIEPISKCGKRTVVNGGCRCWAISRSS